MSVETVVLILLSISFISSCGMLYLWYKLSKEDKEFTNENSQLMYMDEEDDFDV
ncbi:hypothetical protein J2S74_001801 [Evansella vedderi]|uniref:Uncharacterized protein n=1 Tax=Evansella vedderi TaxID=38282 RepID=A0ABT9ZUP1_9BACI|nr:hypothetical protein [Evansella vedderi]MDQ0254426.1 hypothetical protein [Evansella vedderi]